MTELIDPNAGALHQRSIQVLADGVGSTVKLNNLRRVYDYMAYETEDGDGEYSRLEPVNGGVIELGVETWLRGVYIPLDPTGTINVGRLTLGPDSWLSGQGEIVGSVVNASRVTIPAGEGGLTVRGDYRQETSGQLEIDIKGSVDSGNYSRLRVDGDATLAGTLKVNRSHNPSNLDDYVVVASSEIDGDFDTLTGQGDLGAVYGQSVVVLASEFERAESATHDYTNTNPGSRFFFDVTQLADANTEFRLYSPDNRLIFVSQATPGDPDAADFGPFVLKDEGTYTVKVFTAPGQQSTYVWNLDPAPVVSYPLKLGNLASGSIDAPGETHQWQFDVTGRWPISLDVLAVTGQSQNLVFTLKDPEDRIVFRGVAGSDTPDAADLGMQWIEGPGTFTLEVTGLGDDTAGYLFMVNGPSHPRIVGHSLLGDDATTANRAVFHFNQPMDTTDRGFQLDRDLLTLETSAGSLTPSGFQWQDADTLVISFPAISAEETVRAELSPYITSVTGVPLDQNENGRPGEDPDDRYVADLAVDHEGPRVFLTDPREQASVPIDRVTFYFTEPIDPNSVSAADITAFVGPGDVDLRSEVTDVLSDGDSVTLYFVEQGASGEYRLSLGPQILDAAGNPMDQDGDGTPGEPEDGYTWVSQLVAADLVIEDTEVSDPTATVFGNNMQVSWTVRNRGSDPATGKWWDYVYLSRDREWDLDDTLVGTFLYDSEAAGAVPADDGTYTGSLDVPMPGVVPGDYYIIVRTNLLQSIAEADRDNNTAVSLNSAFFDLPELKDEVSQSGEVRFGQALYYKIDVPSDLAGGSLLVRFGVDTADVATELYLRRDALPTRREYDERSTQEGESNQWLLASAVSPGTYYVLAQAAPDNQSTGVAGNFNIAADMYVPGEFTVVDTYFGKGGTAGERTIEINGINFDRTITVSLMRGDEVIADAVRYYRPGPEKLYATFDLTQVDPGGYDVVLRNEAIGRKVVTSALEVIAASAPPEALPVLSAPPAVRPNTPYAFSVTVANDGINDVFAPFLTVANTAPYGLMPNDSSLQTGSRFYVGTMTRVPGVLLPGETVARTFFTAPDNKPGSHVVLVDRIVKNPGAPIDWDTVRRNIVTSLSGETFERVFDQMVSKVGTTNLDYLRMLAYNAALLPNLEEQEITVSLLVSQEFARAASQVLPSLSGRIETPLPFTEAGITLFAQNKTTGEVFTATTLRDGSFSMVDLPDGTYEFVVPGYDFATQSPRTAEIAGGKSVTGIVLSLAPADDFVVNISPTVSEDALQQGLFVLSNESGSAFGGVLSGDNEVRFAAVPKGAYRLFVDLPGYARYVSEVVVDGGTVEITLQRQGTITGQVAIDGDTVTEVYAAATLQPEADGYSYVAFGDDGTFSFEGLRAGTYRIVVAANGLSRELGAVEVVEGERLELGTIVLSQDRGGESEPAVVEHWIHKMQGIEDLLLDVEEWLWLALPLMRVSWGASVRNLYETFLGNTPDRVDRYWFYDGSEIVEGSWTPFGIGFREYPDVDEALAKALNDAADAVAEYMRDGNVSCELALTSWEKKVPVSSLFGGRIEAPINFRNAETIPGVTAGGVGRWEYIPNSSVARQEKRWIDGNVVVRRIGPSAIEIESELTFTVVDSIDFQPGNLSDNKVERAVTTKLDFLENYGHAWGVPYVVHFTDKPGRVVKRQVPEEKCCEGPDCSDDEKVVERPRSFDPNDIIGPTGVGSENWITPDRTLPYMIRFENDAEKASAPAAVVRVEHRLDDDLDYSTFRLGVIQFGDTVIEEARGRASFEKRLDLREKFGIFLDVKAGIDRSTGQAFWELKSIDPATGEIPFNPLVGFLPPNKDGTEGQGYVTYTIRPKEGLSTGTKIDAVATIFFDQNEPIDTPPIANTIDAGPPESAVEALPASAYPGMIVRWSGQDDAGGSGIAKYDVYVSKNGAAPEPWLLGTELTEASFNPVDTSATYAFYSVAGDQVGHREDVPDTPDASTFIGDPPRVTDVQTGSPSTRQLLVTFTDPVSIDGLGQDAVRVLDTSGQDVTPSQNEFAFDTTDNTLTITWGEDLAAGNYRLDLAVAAFQTSAGATLAAGMVGPEFRVQKLEAGTFASANDEPIDVGECAAPIWYDWNRDGTHDLVVGQRTLDGEAKIRVYLNQGTDAAPSYDEPFFVQTLAGDLTIPADDCPALSIQLVDWNGDGEQDLVLGRADGRVEVWRNVDTNEEPLFVAPFFVQAGDSENRADLDVGDGATIALVDWDGDGLVDLLNGAADGKIRLFRNDGQAGNPHFTAAEEITLGGEPLTVPGGRAAIAPVDFNGDGLLDLLVGNSNGTVLFYPNVGTDASAQFVAGWELTLEEPEVGPFGLDRAQMRVADVDGDGNVDLIVGKRDGKIRVYKGTGEWAGLSQEHLIANANPDSLLYGFTVPKNDLPRSWRNPVDPYDVTGDGVASPADVLQVLLELDSRGVGDLPLPSAEQSPPPYVDVNGDGRLTPVDALTVLEAVSGQSNGEGEAERWSSLVDEIWENEEADNVLMDWLDEVSSTGTRR